MAPARCHQGFPPLWLPSCLPRPLQGQKGFPSCPALEQTLPTFSVLHVLNWRKSGANLLACIKWGRMGLSSPSLLRPGPPGAAAGGCSGVPLPQLSSSLLCCGSIQGSRIKLPSSFHADRQSRAPHFLPEITLLRGCTTHPALTQQRALPRTRGCGADPLQHFFWKCNACSPAHRCRAAPASWVPRALGGASPSPRLPFLPPAETCPASPLQTHAAAAEPPAQPCSHPSRTGAGAEGIHFTDFNNSLEMGKTFFFNHLPSLYFTQILCCRVSFSWPRLTLESKGLEVRSPK